MRFLCKASADLEPYHGLSYSTLADRDTARDALTRVQFGFCAYSERCLRPLDSVDIEHFDPRKKGTNQDGIENWHAVLHWMNSHKARKIEPYLPLPPLNGLIPDRIRYERGQFCCRDGDVESDNLLKFLGVNRPEVAEERKKHVERVRRVKDWCERLGEDLHSFLQADPDYLSFASALEAELGIPAFDLIVQQSQRDSCSRA